LFFPRLVGRLHENKQRPRAPIKGGDSFGDSVQTLILPLFVKVLERYKSSPGQKKEMNRQTNWCCILCARAEGFYSYDFKVFSPKEQKGRSKMEKNLASGQNCPLNLGHR
jgi:hypothetical protein